MVKILFLLEDIKQINQVIEDSEKISGQSTYISLSPSASYAFERARIPYKSIRDYGGGEERYRQGLENFQRIDRIVAILDQELAFLHNIPSLAPARYSMFNLKILFDVLWITIYNLKGIIEAEQPDFIRLYASPGMKDRNYVFSYDNLIYTNILKMPGWNVPIEIIENTESNNPDCPIKARPNSIVSRLMIWINEQHLLFNLGLISKRQGIGRAAIASLYYITCLHRKPVLIYNNGYNWDDSLVELFRQGMTPVYRIRDETIYELISNDRDYQSDVRNLCNVHPGMREFDHVLGIDVSGFLFELISQIIGRSIRESIAVYPLAREMIKKKKIRCLLYSVHISAIGHTIIQAGHDEGIPVISWQHGGAGYCSHPMMPFIEFVNSDWHFVFGEGVAKSYRSTSDIVGLKKTPVFVPVGSSSLDWFQMKERRTDKEPAKKPVVYISTAYLRNFFIMSQPFDPVDWDEHLWDLQKQILNLAKRNPDKEFIIKLHSVNKNMAPLLNYKNDNNIKNVNIIISEKTVRELVDIADAVIFDSISTGILQVLTSKVPVFVFTGLHEIDEETILPLKKCAYVYKKTGDLMTALNEYIHTRKVTDYPVDIHNHDFIIWYGTEPGKYRSAESAIKKLNEILLKN